MATTAEAIETTVATVTLREAMQARKANESGRQPVMFLHGLWLLHTSWNRWAMAFEQAGYATLTPGWPDDPVTVREGNAHPDLFAGKSIRQVADHFASIIEGLHRKPILIGHSFGGLLAQMLAGRGLAATTIAIDPAGFRGVLPLPFSALRSAWPVLGNPANFNRAVALSFKQFRYAFANAVDESEAQALYAQFAVPAAGKPLFQAAMANFNPWTEARVDTRNGARGPLLIISGEKDHTVPSAVAKAAFRRQRRNSGVTEFVEMPGRGHALTIDHGWQEVAQTAMKFIERVCPQPVLANPLAAEQA